MGIKGIDTKREYYNTVAFIPARGGSKSIPLKNIKQINGRPLIYWALDAAVLCNEIDKVFVSTDSDEIRKVVDMYGSEKVVVIGRSKETATDTASTESAMLEFAEYYDFNNIILIQVTSPLIDTVHIKKGIDLINTENFDSVISVVRQKRFIWRNTRDTIVPVNYDPQCRPRRQAFNGYLVENGAFYITKKSILLDSKCRISGKIAYVEMPEESYFEIDEPSDWIIVEQLLKRCKNVQNSINLNKIKIVLTDSDGVLTDGGMYYSENGDELKKFNTKDGMAVQLLREKGIRFGIITGENRQLVKKRAEKLKVDELHMGIKNKLEILEKIKEKYNLDYSEIAYIGDDINDIDVIKKVGFGCSVADGMEIVRKTAKYVTKAKGGQGAIREIAELILDSV